MKPSTTRTLVIITLILFGALTAIALWVEGLWGIFASITSSWGSVQIFVDLVIALSMVMVWMYRDARAQGRNPWPWLVATLAVGAFSPLVYLLVRDSTEHETQPVKEQTRAQAQHHK